MFQIKKVDFTSNTPQMRFLTNAPNPIRVAWEDSCYLSFFCGNTAEAVQVQGFNASGALVFDDFILNNPPGTGLAQQSIGAGPANLQAAPFDGLSNFVNSIKNYSVTVVDSSRNPAPLSETRDFIITDSPCNKFRLHFINQFGVLDSVTFTAETETALAFENNVAMRPLPLEYTNEDASRVRYGFDADEVYSVSQELFTRAGAVWIKELLVSPAVFVEVEVEDDTNKNIPIIIESGQDFVSYLSNSNEVEFDLDFKLSQKFKTT